MEKKTIIAFALSFVVLLVWSLLFAPKQQQMPPERKETPEKGKPAVTEAPRPSIPDQTKLPKPVRKGEKILPRIEEKEIRVETPLYQAIFSNRGGKLMSFKLKKYHITTDPDSPMIELAHPKENGEDLFGIRFGHQSASKAEEIFCKTDKDALRLDEGSSPGNLTFSSVTPDGVSINQTFRFYPDTYYIDLLVTLLNNAEKPMEGYLEAHLKNAPLQKKGYYSFVGVALLLNGELEEFEPKEMKKDKGLSGKIGWMAYEDNFFMTAVIPDDYPEGHFRGRLLPSGSIGASYFTPPISLKNQDPSKSRFTLYLGPRDLGILKQIGKKLDMAINFGWTDIIAKPLLYALRFFNQYVNNYGISIIILTILVKILFWPLTHKSYKSMKEMQKLQPIMAKMRQKYKDDKQRMNQELMGLYKTYKVNPMGGCLPMVIQIPVFFALFRVLGNSIELRHAPFLLWINDLSAPDRLFHFPFDIPFMSPPYGIPVLTLLMGASMFVQQKMTPTPGDPTQAKIMLFLPLIFTVMFINFPSGLVLYWLVNNILSIGQQYRIKRSAD